MTREEGTGPTAEGGGGGVQEGEESGGRGERPPSGAGRVAATMLLLR